MFNKVCGWLIIGVLGNWLVNWVSVNKDLDLVLVYVMVFKMMLNFGGLVWLFKLLDMICVLMKL